MHRYVLVAAIKLIIFVIVGYILVEFATDFQAFAVISESYNVKVKNPDSRFIRYALTPLRRSDLYYYQISSGDMWLKEKMITDKVIDCPNINYGGVHLLLESKTEKKYFNFRYDHKTEEYYLDQLLDSDCTSIKEYKTYQLIKSLVIFLSLFALVAAVDVLFLKAKRKGLILNLIVSIVISLGLVYYVYKPFYDNLFDWQI